MSLEDVRELCVTNFPASTIRADLMAAFEVIRERALSLEICGEAWVDGSFLTQKVDPGDIDFIFLIDDHYYDRGTREQYEFVEWLLSREDDPKKSFLCHTDVVLVYPADSPLHQITINTRKHWEENVYGFSVATHDPKGIVVVGLALPALGAGSEH